MNTMSSVFQDKIDDTSKNKQTSLQKSSFKITAAFSATLCNDVELDQLREQLLAVVQETMQSSHVSLWVRQLSRSETPSLQVGRYPTKGCQST